MSLSVYCALCFSRESYMIHILALITTIVFNSSNLVIALEAPGIDLNMAVVTDVTESPWPAPLNQNHDRYFTTKSVIDTLHSDGTQPIKSAEEEYRAMEALLDQNIKLKLLKLPKFKAPNKCQTEIDQLHLNIKNKLNKYRRSLASRKFYDNTQIDKLITYKLYNTSRKHLRTFVNNKNGLHCYEAPLVADMMFPSNDAYFPWILIHLTNYPGHKLQKQLKDILEVYESSNYYLPPVVPWNIRHQLCVLLEWMLDASVSTQRNRLGYLAELSANRNNSPQLSFDGDRSVAQAYANFMNILVDENNFDDKEALARIISVLGRLLNEMDYVIEYYNFHNGNKPDTPNHVGVYLCAIAEQLLYLLKAPKRVEAIEQLGIALCSKPVGTLPPAPTSTSVSSLPPSQTNTSS